MWKVFVVVAVGWVYVPHSKESGQATHTHTHKLLSLECPFGEHSVELCSLSCDSQSMTRQSMTSTVSLLFLTDTYQHASGDTK